MKRISIIAMAAGSAIAAAGFIASLVAEANGSFSAQTFCNGFGFSGLAQAAIATVAYTVAKP